MRKTASQTTLLIFALCVVGAGVVMVHSATAATAVSIEYKGMQSFTVQPGEGWLVHTRYNQPQKNTSGTSMTVEPFDYDAFLCKGGECPAYLEYHYGDTVDMGTVQAGAHIRLQNYLHDNPGDGRRTRVMKGNDVVKVCDEGWVAPDCVYAVFETGNYKVKFEDSVAVEVVKVEPRPTPSATPTPTVAPTATPEPTVAPTATPTPVATQQPTTPPSTGGDGRSDGRTESLGCQKPSDNCNTAVGGHVLSAQTLPVTGSFSDVSGAAVAITTLVGMIGLNVLRLARVMEEEVRG